MSQLEEVHTFYYYCRLPCPKQQTGADQARHRGRHPAQGRDRRQGDPAQLCAQDLCQGRQRRASGNGQQVRFPSWIPDRLKIFLFSFFFRPPPAKRHAPSWRPLPSSRPWNSLASKSPTCGHLSLFFCCFVFGFCKQVLFRFSRRSSTPSGARPKFCAPRKRAARRRRRPTTRAPRRRPRRLRPPRRRHLILTPASCRPCRSSPISCVLRF